MGNAILPDLQQKTGLGPAAIGNITSAIQFGFISGTLVFALFGIADRFSPSRVFFFSALVAALSNFCINWWVDDGFSLLSFRFITGFFLAGVYPVGMKIAADWYEKGLGKALGWLVGALVLGTAFPHLLRASAFRLPPDQIILFTSVFAFFGGLLILLFVPNGPFRKRGQSFHTREIRRVFQNRDFKAAAFGYFGHMWEVYTFWTFVPVLLAFSVKDNLNFNLPVWSFLIIGIGALSCIAGGYLSMKWSSAKVAFISLLVSGTCCLASLLFLNSGGWIFLLFMITWGITAVSDSPQFSALVARTAPQESRGTALTISTCIGFSITIISIELINYLFRQFQAANWVFMLLAIGPLFGLLSMRRLLR